MNNLRRFERYTVSQSTHDDVTVVVERQSVHLLNFSVGGIYIASKSSFPLGKVNVSVQIKNCGSIELTGYIVRKKREGDMWGIAITFKDIHRNV